jgi:hypothetical protein
VWPVREALLEVLLAGFQGLELHVDHFEISVPMPPSDQKLQRQAAAYSSYLSPARRSLRAGLF